MSGVFGALLESRDWLLADGAVGTNLFRMGLEPGEAPELWNATDPGRVRALHEGWVGAGCDIFLTNSFGANASRLARHDAEDRVYDLNRRAAEIAREVADAAGRPVAVGGSIGPTGEGVGPGGSLDASAAEAMFGEQARGLRDGGADLVWIETFSAPAEFEAAVRAAAAAGLPWCGTMSFDTNGRTMAGLDVAGFAALVAGLPAPPLAFGANCGVGASDLVRSLIGLAGAAPGAALIAKANAGVPKFVSGRILYDGTPELMARYALLARDAGARIIGGCCGSTPAHLGAMRVALESRPRGAAPDLAAITGALGPLSPAETGPGTGS
ncbi:betaine--homocysteine S-methyltransferase [Amaricoccus solimangrovi]|uniref:Betaine--homocysteine S-methyltransferase n=1 Tax=Amaricoccus solimangrovi TaxID=2589815 RepID=A0A501WPV1_9RHOB|nr:betaine--homocysteine S-methyltransferase [Amaricoccus solimangrovi]TPE51368.1 betaine--homocysteine S-methyltransferase [Amaricoccus solimangrovi]